MATAAAKSVNVAGVASETYEKIEAIVAALIEAIEQLRFDGSRKPLSDQLRMAWPDLGRAWIAEWARELGRDLRTTAENLEAAEQAPSEEEALVPLENALWRLGAAREKFFSVVALAFGIPSLQIGKDKKQTLSFRPNSETCRRKLRELQGVNKPARRILDLDGKLKQSLLLRHQATHSLAPLIKSHSLTWFEAALIERGSVNHYLAFHLPPKGLDSLDDIGSGALRSRAQTLTEQGLSLIVEATSELAELLTTAAELEPPPIIWKAVETNRCFYTRDEASFASRTSSRGA